MPLTAGWKYIQSNVGAKHSSTISTRFGFSSAAATRSLSFSCLLTALKETRANATKILHSVAPSTHMWNKLATHQNNENKDCRQDNITAGGHDRGTRFWQQQASIYQHRQQQVHNKEGEYIYLQLQLHEFRVPPLYRPIHTITLKS